MSVLRLLDGCRSVACGDAARGLRLADVGRASEAAPPPAGAPLPASIPAQDLVGRWGLAAYHKDEDRARTEAAARGQCRQPYNISRGPGGGVIMHLPDQAQPTELLPQGRAGRQELHRASPRSRAGGQRDREIVSFDGRVLITRFVDPGGLGPLRHQRLRALRRRDRPGRQEGRAEGREEDVRRRPRSFPHPERNASGASRAGTYNRASDSLCGGAHARLVPQAAAAGGEVLRPVRAAFRGRREGRRGPARAARRRRGRAAPLPDDHGSRAGRRQHHARGADHGAADLHHAVRPRRHQGPDHLDG